MLDEPHQPARRNGPKDEQGEAEGAKPDHHARLCALRDAKHDGSKQGEQQHSVKMRDRQEAFLPVASECASTAAMMFNSPATTTNFVP